MTARTIALSYPENNNDTEPFIKRKHPTYKHHQQHLTARERHQNYLHSLSTCDRFLIKFEDWCKRNNIPSALISVILISSAFFIAFLFIIVFISNHKTTKTAYHSSISNNKNHRSHIIHSMTSNNIIKKIKILLISDIHLNKTNVNKVHRFITASKTRIDHLWVPGDFLNLTDEENDDEKKLQHAENELIDLLKEIKKIHPNPVIIPGNHDPKTLFFTDKDKYFKFAECINIHNKLYHVDGETNLFMAGFGGSVPAFCEEKVCWPGYPYKNDTEFGKDYNVFINGIANKEEILKTDKNIVLFTHNGPSLCSTTMDWRLNDENKIITSGSMSIAKSMLNAKFRDKVFLNIHGHTHKGFGQGHIGNVRIINPGSLKGGSNNNFALLDLVQLKDETWKVDSVEFKTVDLAL